MADYTVLNPGVGGDVMDETGVTYGVAPLLRKRPNVVISGLGAGDLVPAPSTNPVGTEPGLVTRPIHSPYPGTSIVSLSSVTLVSSNTETTIASYTVPTSQTFYFLGFVGSGDVHAIYKLYLESNAMFSARTSVASPTAQISFPYAVFTASAGQTVRLKGTHFVNNVQANFDGSIVGYVL